MTFVAGMPGNCKDFNARRYSGFVGVMPDYESDWHERLFCELVETCFAMEMLILSLFCIALTATGYEYVPE